jgi:hypothetical protein
MENIKVEFNELIQLNNLLIKVEYLDWWILIILVQINIQKETS